ncbi:MAG: SO2930 family diheme c-type cytochrome [Cyclobacteriaceae bacterium]
MRSILKITLIIIWIGVVFVSGCQSNKEKTSAIENTTSKTESRPNLSLGFDKLSDYNFFQGKMADMIPVSGVVPYDLNTPLFSDYALKLRFVQVPEGAKVPFQADAVFDFPVGTVLIKTFYYPNDFTKPGEGRTLMETRLLIHEETGWKALPYIWDEEQTEAYLEITGGNREVSWTHVDRAVRKINYSIPNVNQCKGCHIKGKEILPIGPSARQLNKDFNYQGKTNNQLLKWASLEILDELPENKSVWPKIPVWNQPETGSIAERARAYLEINCAHCHSAAGPAKTSGLMLDYHEANPAALGVGKAPVAAGRGSGGRFYSIVPGEPEASILVYRMEATDPAIMMPEMGRKQTHKEGVALIREWIAGMERN